MSEDISRPLSLGKTRFFFVLTSLFFTFFMLFMSLAPAKSWGSQAIFTQEELEFIAANPVIQAASIDGAAPHQYLDSKGVVKGIGVNVLDEVSAITGIIFECHLYDSVDLASASDARVFFGVSKEYMGEDSVLSTPYLHSETILFYNSEHNPADLGDKLYVAIDGATLPEGIKQENALLFDNKEDTFWAVEKGIGDYGFSNPYSLAFYSIEHGFNNIVTVPMAQESREYCLCLDEGDLILLGILNKAIESIDMGRLQSLILSAVSDVRPALSLKSVARAYWVQFTLAIAAVLGLLAYYWQSERRANQRLKAEMLRVKEQEESIKRLSYHDALTGLHNRWYLNETIPKLLVEENLPICAIVGDLDGLKLANDVFGHAAGDDLLKKAAEILVQSSPEGALVARIGGDEFLVLLPKTSGRATGEVTEKIQGLLDISPVDTIPVRMSLGYACIDTVDAGLEGLEAAVSAAETMMYAEKIRERRKVRFSFVTFLEASLYEKGLETPGHGERLCTLTRKVGGKLGLSSNELDDLCLLARLHDIGKVAAAQEALEAYDEQSEEAISRARRHAEAGYRIAESSMVISSIADNILYHHERWDGKGYPMGLKGEEIPLLSRIVAIADAYDMMTYGAPQQKPMSKEEAIRELIASAGTRFDPDLVPVFISVLEEP